MPVNTIILNRPNWLGSEIGLVTKSITVPAGTAGAVVENGRTIVKSGTIFTTPYSGLLFTDVDVTDGDAVGALMIRGSYIDAKLPASASAQATNFQNQGLYAITEGAVTRPDFGDVETLTKLTIGAVTPSTGGSLSWSQVTNAVGYAVYESTTQSGNYTQVATIAQTASPKYTGTATRYYKVKALGDNLNYADSDFSTAVAATA